ncbi:hypothetical protein OG760_22195 [Streptomyces sp. NBC_00963]|uniref:hypothetical protein n=1 Tax=Streptomyces sp. NBC_00963 TaxID=2903697 RepID=UPI00386E0E55|nr:hypothetical protein OG760_22195 [Streptomyces sp. NBC_00963]
MTQPVPPPQPPDPSSYRPPDFGFPMAPQAAPPKVNMAGGIVTAVITALVVGAAYGGVLGATKHEFGYAAVAVGFIIGFAAGKVGGDHVGLAAVGAVLSLASVYFGQLLGEAIIASKQLPVSVPELFFQHFGLLNDAWRADADFLSYLFIAIAAGASFAGMKRAL